MLRTRPYFRHSPRDLQPALGGAASVLLLLGAFLAFGSLSRGAAVLMVLLVGLVICWNIHCVAHCFLHHPFFRKGWLNRAYGVLESLAIGMPLVLFRHHHLSRHGQSRAPGHFWRHCLLSFYRMNPRTLLRAGLRQGREPAARAIVETAVLLLFWLVMLIGNWRAFLGFYVPAYLLGWVLAFAQEYLEQYGARPDNPFASTVNSRSRLYNLLTFNHGYQQEHRWDPDVHWTRLPELHGRLAPHLLVNDAPTLRGPHLTAPVEYFLRRRVQSWRRRKATRSAA